MRGRRTERRQREMKTICQFILQKMIILILLAYLKMIRNDLRFQYLRKKGLPSFMTFKEGKCCPQNSFYFYCLQVSSVKLTKIIKVRTNKYYLELHVAKNHPPLPRQRNKIQVRCRRYFSGPWREPFPCALVRKWSCEQTRSKVSLQLTLKCIWVSLIGSETKTESQQRKNSQP